MADRICSIPDCDRPHVARGWCQKHWQRWANRGRGDADPAVLLPRYGFKIGSPGRPRDTDYPALFETYVDRTTTPDGCHTWTGGCDRDGYGVFGVNGHQIRANRFALEQA